MKTLFKILELSLALVGTRSLVIVALVVWALPQGAMADYVSEHESRIKEIWVGTEKEYLIEGYGAPEIELEIPGQYPGISYVMVYPAANIGGDTQCFDAFIVNKQTSLITGYYCR